MQVRSGLDRTRARTDCLAHRLRRRVRFRATRSAGQNVTEAVQNSFDCGLIGQGAGRIRQSSLSIFGAPHDLGALLPSALIRRPYQTTPLSVISIKSGARAELLAQVS